jgi:hypothetical protein
LKKVLAVFALVASCGLAADWTGYLVDKSCAGKKAMWGNEQCAQSCLKRGDPAVFVTADGTIYQVADQDKVKSLAGKKVTITGKMDGTTITVDTVKPAE